MTSIHHLNCGTLHSPFIGNAVCHCLLLDDEKGYALVDTGFGTKDIQHPELRIGEVLMQQFKPVFREESTAIHQLKKRGVDPMAVCHCIISHLDFDHVGGLADFPEAIVHLCGEELVRLQREDPRYLQSQFSHQPKFKSYTQMNTKWYGLPAYQIELGFTSEVLLVPLFGHTLGHCGVAIQQQNKWLFYAGDAYFSHEELAEDNHYITQQAAAAAADNQMRLASFHTIQRLRDIEEVEIFCYHDPFEFRKFKT